jgi:hypothetical protein
MRLSARCGGLQRGRDEGRSPVTLVREEGHDGGYDPKVKTTAVTRCLSPLGTGNDETGFVDSVFAATLVRSNRSSLTVPSLVGNR